MQGSLYVPSTLCPHQCPPVSRRHDRGSRGFLETARPQQTSAHHCAVGQDFTTETRTAQEGWRISCHHPALSKAHSTLGYFLRHREATTQLSGLWVLHLCSTSEHPELPRKHVYAGTGTELSSVAGCVMSREASALAAHHCPQSGSRVGRESKCRCEASWKEQKHGRLCDKPASFWPTRANRRKSDMGR